MSCMVCTRATNYSCRCFAQTEAKHSIQKLEFMTEMGQR